MTLFNEGYTERQNITYTINKIMHIYQSNLQCGILTYKNNNTTTVIYIIHTHAYTYTYHHSHVLINNDTQK